MRRMTLLFIIALAGMSFSAPQLFREKYQTETLYTATYNKNGFSGFRKDEVKKRKISKKLKIYFHTLNHIIDSLGMINWNSDTVYCLIQERRDIGIWTSRDRKGYYISFPYGKDCYKVQPLDSVLVTCDPSWTASNRLFMETWQSNDTTKIKQLLGNSGHINDYLQISRFIIYDKKIVSRTNYIFLNSIRWKNDTTNFRKINFYNDYDELKLIGY